MTASNKARGNKRRALPKPGSARYRALQRLRSPLLAACDAAAAKPARPKRKPVKTPVAFPVWFPDDERNQQVAEFLAFNVWLDKLLGKEPSADRAPYSEFDPDAVKPFLARLHRETAGRSPVPASPAA